MTHKRGKGQRNTWIQSKCTKKLYLDIKWGSIWSNSQNGLYGHLYILKS